MRALISLMAAKVTMGAVSAVRNPLRTIVSLLSFSMNAVLFFLLALLVIHTAG